MQTLDGWRNNYLRKCLVCITEKSECAICEYVTIKHLTGIQIEDIKLKKSNSESFIREFCSVPNSTFPKCDSPDAVENKLIEIGK